MPSKTAWPGEPSARDLAACGSRTEATERFGAAGTRAWDRVKRSAATAARRKQLRATSTPPPSPSPAVETLLTASRASLQKPQADPSPTSPLSTTSPVNLPSASTAALHPLLSPTARPPVAPSFLTHHLRYLPPTRALALLEQASDEVLAPLMGDVRRARKQDEVFGEVEPGSFAEMLSTLSLDTGALLVDLGAGTGTACAAAALVNGFNSIGLELLPARASAGGQLLSHLEAGCGKHHDLSPPEPGRHPLRSSTPHPLLPERNTTATVALLAADFFTCPFLPTILSRASVIYTDDFKFSPETRHQLGKLLRHAPSGAYIASFHSYLPSERDRHRPPEEQDLLAHLVKERVVDVAVSWSGRKVPMYIAKWVI